MWARVDWWTGCVFAVLQEENRELQRLVVDIASDKQTAAERLASLKARHSQLSAQVMCPLTPASDRAVGRPPTGGLTAFAILVVLRCIGQQRSLCGEGTDVMWWVVH